MEEWALNLLSALPETDYGRALFLWIDEEVKEIEAKEEFGLKICDDPLNDDFRFVLGLKAAFKRVLRKPQECKRDLELLKQTRR